MKKIPAIYIDRFNHDQVEWWNKIGRHLVKAVKYDEVVETATNKSVGVIFVVTGLLSKFVVSKVESFIKNPVETTL